MLLRFSRSHAVHAMGWHGMPVSMFVNGIGTIEACCFISVEVMLSTLQDGVAYQYQRSSDHSDIADRGSLSIGYASAAIRTAADCCRFICEIPKRQRDDIARQCSDTLTMDQSRVVPKTTR